MLKFLPGLVLLQAITISMFLLSPESLSGIDGLQWIKLILPLAVSALLMAFWFSSISARTSQDEIINLKEAHADEREELRYAHQDQILSLKEAHAKESEEFRTVRQDEILNLKETHAKERETIRVRAERAKHKVTKDAQKQVEKEIRRTSAKANFKVGAAVAGAVGVGGLLILTQFVTLGVMILTTAGGTAGGYMLRYRQEKTKALPQDKKVVLLEPEKKKRLPKT
uniref:Uncharacterized protein n=1 Tax=uncultured Thiotrichaceae bacterium TaxID=298394 RepID=A0A6S6SRF4_9GAMM|nr:MAG: Unknown protein [uncultured Thiotrichaceae bacterium]